MISEQDELKEVIEILARCKSNNFKPENQPYFKQHYLNKSKSQSQLSIIKNILADFTSSEYKQCLADLFLLHSQFPTQAEQNLFFTIKEFIFNISKKLIRQNSDKEEDSDDQEEDKNYGKIVEKNDKWKAQVNGLQIRKIQLEKQVKAYKEQIKNVEHQVEKQKQQIKSLRLQIEQQRKKMQNLNRECQSLKEKSLKVDETNKKIMKKSHEIKAKDAIKPLSVQLNKIKDQNLQSKIKVKLQLQSFKSEFKEKISMVQKHITNNFNQIQKDKKNSNSQKFVFEFPHFSGNIFNGFKSYGIEEVQYNPPQVYFSRSLAKSYPSESQEYARLQQMRGRLINLIQSEVRNKIVCTKLLFTFDQKEIQKNPHPYIDNQPNNLLLIRLKNGYVIAAFSSEALKQAGQKEIGYEFITVLNTERVYKTEYRLEGARFLSYNPYYLVYGNSELRVQIGKKEVYSNFGISQAFLKPRDGPQMLFGENVKSIEFTHYEVYQVFFDKSGYW